MSLIQSNTKTTEPNKYRALFISDTHLGAHQCKAERLYNFLCENDAEKIYLIGDIIETAGMKRWPPYHDLVLKILCEKARTGTEIVFIPGNHDSIFRYHIGQYGNLKILNHAYHQRLDGRTLLLIHGDETDMIRFEFLLWFIAKFERWSKIHLWEVLRRVCTSWVESHTLEYEDKIIKLTRSTDLSGVVCGHIHYPKISERDGFLYLNCGDFTWHCSAICETYDGKFELLYG
jgi:UDP-2,3-diacylglucosamine pyrophosphatase LpxH